MTFTVGQRFGNLTVNSVSPIARSKAVYLSCTCDCGKEVTVRKQDLVCQHTRSCGCFAAAKNKMLKFQTADDRMLQLYKDHAKKRRREFALSDEEALKLFKQPCTYCGALPFKNTKSKAKLQIPTNGIDRIDNKLGYVPGNVVPACTLCNMMKHKLGVEEFLDQISRIAKHNSWWRKLKMYLRANLWSLT